MEPVVVFFMVAVFSAVSVLVTLLLSGKFNNIRLRQLSDELEERMGKLDELEVEKKDLQERVFELDKQLVNHVSERDRAIQQLESVEVLHKQNIANESARLQELQARHESVVAAQDSLMQQRSEAQQKLAALRAEHEARMEELANAREQLDTQFKGMAAEVLKATGDNLMEQAKEHFSQQSKSQTQQFTHQAQLNNSEMEKRHKDVRNLVNPINDRLEKFEQLVSQLEVKREGAYQGLTKELELMRGETLSLRDVTGSLNEAMKSSRARGLWGEHQLRRILEMSGMLKHIDFDEQRSALSGDSGENYVRPDAVVHVPGGIEVVIDAKTPLESYLEACNTDDDKLRGELLTRHAQSLRSHARSLGSKKYTEALAKSPDFTLMFVPADPILDVAMDTQPALWSDAWDKHRVLITTPGLLLAFLRTVALAWEQQHLQENAQEIAQHGTELHKRLGIYMKYVHDLGKSLQKTVDTYNRSVSSMEGRLLPQARRFEKLGIAESRMNESDKFEPVPVTTNPRELTSLEAREALASKALKT